MERGFAMRLPLLASATLLAATAAPAWAAPPAPRAPAGVFVSGTHGNDGDHRRDRRRGDAAVILDFGRSGEWAYANNRAFEPDSYNDWWHDRPDRAYPRWMANNGGCERRWWSGGGWRC